MLIRAIGQNWHFRFKLKGCEHTGNTGLPAVEANRAEAELRARTIRELVKLGIPHASGARTSASRRRVRKALEDFLNLSKIAPAGSAETALAMIRDELLAVRAGLDRICARIEAIARDRPAEMAHQAHEGQP